MNGCHLYKYYHIIEMEKYQKYGIRTIYVRKPRKSDSLICVKIKCFDIKIFEDFVICVLNNVFFERFFVKNDWNEKKREELLIRLLLIVIDCC